MEHVRKLSEPAQLVSNGGTVALERFAPEVASSCRRTIIVRRQGLRLRRGWRLRDDVRSLARRAWAPQFPWCRSADGRDDPAVLAPHPMTSGLVLTHVHPGVDVDDVVGALGRELLVADGLSETPARTAPERGAL